MKIFIQIFFIIILLIPYKTYSREYLYILDDECINDLYQNSTSFFKDTEIETIRDPRGIILRFYFDDPINEYKHLSPQMRNKILYIEYFLANLENPAIIEVHTENFPNGEIHNLKKWEISTIIANNVETIITKPIGTVEQRRINSVGYGEFLPAKNTSNNGGKHPNRVDIIVLCNVSGE